MSRSVYSSRHCNVCINFRENTPTSYYTLPKPGSRLHKCDQCYLVRYCDQHHQKLDWPLHRDLCQAIKKVNNHMEVPYIFDINGKIDNVNDMQHTVAQIKFLVRCFLRRELNVYESEMINFSEYCAVCFSRRKLETCTNCNAVSYCSTEHREAHAKEHNEKCELLKRCYIMCDVTQMKFDYTLHEKVPCRDLNLTDAFQLLTHTKLESDPLVSSSAIKDYFAAADFSCIGTIAYAMELLKLNDTEEFTIFIIGVTVERQLWFQPQHIKFFFMQFPSIINLTLHFIGPEMFDCEEHEPIVQICDLEGVEHTSTNICHHIHFEEFARFYENIQPSIMVVYNCGFGEKEFAAQIKPKFGVEFDADSFRWKRGIKSMLHYENAPIVFTSYTKSEAHTDFSVIEGMAKENVPQKHLERTCEVRSNPYKDLRPHRNWELTDPEDFYYRNNYLQIVRPQLTS